MSEACDIEGNKTRTLARKSIPCTSGHPKTQGRPSGPATEAAFRCSPLLRKPVAVCALCGLGGLFSRTARLMPCTSPRTKAGALNRGPLQTDQSHARLGYGRWSNTRPLRTDQSWHRRWALLQGAQHLRCPSYCRPSFRPGRR
jgi:hypothetical protein